MLPAYRIIPLIPANDEIDETLEEAATNRTRLILKGRMITMLIQDGGTGTMECLLVERVIGSEMIVMPVYREEGQ